MLEKIVQIKNVGRFRNYSSSGDLMFRKMTLVYAENGRGKTTLCAILRSLHSGKAEYIQERKTLAATDQPFVHLRFNGNNYQFTNDAWTATHPEIAIFDPVFVNENVYSGDYVDHEHRKNLYRVIVGAQGVQLARKIEKLDGKIRDANTELRTKRDVISQNLPKGISMEQYLQWQPVDDIDAQIQNKTEQVNSSQRAVVKSDEIQARKLLTKVQIPIMPSDFVATLEKQLTDIVTDAEAKVKEQISQHQMGQQGEAWLSQGLAYVNDDRCPFCGQEIQSNEIIKSYRSHFNAAYQKLKEEVTQLSQRINDAIGEKVISATQQTISENAIIGEFWRQFGDINLPDIFSLDIQQKYAALREQCMRLVEEKENNPAEPVILDGDFSSAYEAVESLQPVIKGYNEAVERSNKLIAEQKAAVRQNDHIAALKRELTQLEFRKQRFDTEVIEKCMDYQTKMAEKTALEQEKEAARQQLDQHCRELLRIYEQSINEYLDQFNAGFRITNTRHLYTGGTPSSLYQIEIDNTALDLGDTRTPPGVPCFRTALSSGDRSALALAFFLALLRHDQQIGNKIVVFDDPFTSLDRFRRTCTQQLIQSLLERTQQVVVLSHDPLFLKLLLDESLSSVNHVKTLQMSRAGDSTIIGEWDVNAETQSPYMQDYSVLLGFYRERKGDLRAVVRAIRPFLEGWLRSHFPGHFQPTEWLGDFISKIRAEDGTSGLRHAKADLVELEAINAYSKRYHHQQNPNADAEPINSDELHGYLKRTLRLVGGA